MEDIESELAIFCNQTRRSMVGPGFIWLICWLRGSRGDYQTTQERGSLPEN